MFKDMQDYLIEAINDTSVDSVLDVGTGMKGVVAQHYWENIQKIKKGYACDIWVIKELPTLWTPLKMDALKLRKVLNPKSLDVVQACGFLEHLSKLDGYRFLRLAERLARKLVFITSAHWLFVGEEMALRIDRDSAYTFALDYKEHGKPYVFIKNLSEIKSVQSEQEIRSDGNPYHRYRSTWSWSEFEELGYETNINDAFTGITFASEVIAWKHLE